MLKKIAVALTTILIILVFSLGAIIVYLNSFQSEEWNNFFTYWVKKSTQYELEITGNTSVELSLHPRIIAKEISLRHLKAAVDSEYLSLGSLDLQVSLFDILYGQIVVERLYLNGLNVHIESGESQVSIDEDSGESSVFRFIVHRVAARDSLFTYTDAEGDLLVLSSGLIHLDSEDKGQSLGVQINGEFQYQPFSITGSVVDPYAIERPKSFELSGRYLNAALHVKGQTRFLENGGQTSFNVLVKTDNVSQLARQFWRSMPRRPDIAMYEYLELGRGVFSTVVVVDDQAIGLPKINFEIGDIKSPNKIRIQGSVQDVENLNALSLHSEIKLQEFSDLSPLIGRKTPKLGKVQAEVKLSGDKGRLNIDSMNITIGDHIVVTGDIADVIRLKTANITAKASFEDLNQVGFIFGRPLPSLGPVTGSLQITTAQRTAQLNQLDVHIGELGKEVLVIGGQIQNLRELKGVNIKSSIDLPSLKLLNTKGNNDFPDFGPIKGDIKLVDKEGTLVVTPIKITGGVSDKVIFELTGYWNDPTGLSDAELDFKLAAKDLGALGKLLKLSAPDKSAPLRLQTHLLAKQNRLSTETFRFDIGDSNVHGNILLDYSGEKPFVSTKLRSSNIDLDDLGFVEVEARGETSGNKQTKKGKGEAGPDPQSQQKSKFIDFLRSEAVIDLSLLRIANLDIALEVDRIHAAKTDLSGFKTLIKLSDGRLQVRPISFDVGSGRASLTASLDASTSPPKVAIELKVSAVNWDELVQPYYQDAVLDGTLDIVAKLHSEGGSTKALVSSTNGRLTFLVSEGSVGTRWLNVLADTNIFRAIFGRKGSRTPLNCLAIQANAKQGRTEDLVLLIDTNRITIIGKGVVDFKRQRINISLDPKSKRIKIFNVPIPIEIKGPLYNPKVKALGKKSLFQKSTLAFGLSLINPSAWIIPYMSVGTREKHPCAKYIIDKKSKKPVTK